MSQKSNCKRAHMRFPTRWGQILSLVLVSVLLTSCESDFIDPFENDTYFFSIYGYFDLLEQTHRVRVVPVTRTPAAINHVTDPQALIDAEVFSINLTTGQEYEWEHELQPLPDGTFAHIFVGHYFPHPDHVYRLEVRRTDGTITAAEAVAPFYREEFPAKVSPLRVVPGRDVTREVIIPDLPTVVDYVVVYEFDNGIRSLRIPVNYAQYGERTDEGAWVIDINFTRDQEKVRFETGKFAFSDDMALTKVALVMKVVDDTWDVPDGIGLEDLVQPRTFSNVINGYGFWGAIGVYAQEWTVDEALSQHLGYK